MTRVYSAGFKPEVRSVLQRLLLDLNVEVVGESADWYTTLAQVPIRRTEMLLVDWDLLPRAAYAAVEELRKACPASWSSCCSASWTSVSRPPAPRVRMHLSVERRHLNGLSTSCDTGCQPSIKVAIRLKSEYDQTT